MTATSDGGHRIARRTPDSKGGYCVNCDLDLAFLNDRDVIYLQTMGRCDHTGRREASSVAEKALDGAEGAKAAQCTCDYTKAGRIIRHPACPSHGLNAVFKPPGDEGPLALPV